MCRIAAILLVLSAIDEPLDLQTLLTSIGRAGAHHAGWYGERRVVQYVFVLTLAGAAGKGGSSLHGIGGNLVEFEVTQIGVTDRVVREWGDHVSSGLSHGNGSRLSGGATGTLATWGFEAVPERDDSSD